MSPEMFVTVGLYAKQKNTHTRAGMGIPYR